MAYVYTTHTGHVTIFSTSSKFRPVSNFTELHTLTLPARSYALVIYLLPINYYLPILSICLFLSLSHYCRWLPKRFATRCYRWWGRDFYNMSWDQRCSRYLCKPIFSSCPPLAISLSLSGFRGCDDVYHGLPHSVPHVYLQHLPHARVPEIHYIRQGRREECAQLTYHQHQ